MELKQPVKLILSGDDERDVYQVDLRYEFPNLLEMTTFLQRFPGIEKVRNFRRKK